MKLRSGTTYNESNAGKSGRRAPTRNRVVRKASPTTTTASRTTTPPLRRSARLRKKRR